MEEVIISLPGIEPEHSDNLVGYWFESASLPMYEDGVIRWYADDKESKRGFRYIEKVTGINFRRTRNIDIAEIVSERGPIDNPLVSGLAEWRSDDPVWRLTVREGKRFRSTVLHEICHALGMDHPEDHRVETDTIMSYKRDKDIKGIYPKDIDILTGLYF